jgi:tyrosinase
LLYFEQIMRQVSGRADFALPYWDWTAHPALPPAFRTPADGSNSLWVSGRNAGIAAGGEISEDIVDVTGDMARTTFFTTASGVGFQPDIEGTPHGAVHVTIGGIMGSVPTAANDPIFWLHHCNIDRLWSKWLAQGGGRTNPSLSSSLGLTSWQFPDANGAVVTIEGRDVFCLQKLGYQYDDHAPPSCGLSIIAIDWSRFRQVLVKRLPPIRILDTLTYVPIRFRSMADVEPFRGSFATTPTNRRLELRLKNIRYDRLPDGPYMVFLNAPRGTRLDHKSRYFIGHIDFFGGESHADSSHQGGTFSQTLDITDQIKGVGGLDRLRRQGLQLTFRKTGLRPVRGRPMTVTRDTLDIPDVEIFEVEVPEPDR